MPSLMWVMPFAAYTPANPVHRTVFLAALTGTVVFALGPRQFAALFGRRPAPPCWHNPRMAMRPTYRVRIEYCVP